MAAQFLDEHVAAQLLSALAPAALELSVTATREAEAHRAEVERIWRQRLERAEFLCGRAQRQYQLAEPENRLVVRQLEREWEATLAERARLGEEYQRYQQQRPPRLSAAELAAIQEATDTYRELATRWPDAYRHRLEQSLRVAAWIRDGEDHSDASSREPK